MKIKTQDLTGPALDLAVAMAWYGYEYKLLLPFFNPSVDWHQGGPIIDKHDIDVLRDGDEFGARLGSMRAHPQREVMSWCCSRGPTKLIAAMRCYVASKLGDEVDIPEELL